MRRAVAALWDSVRRVLIEAVDDPASELRVRIADGLAALGVRLRSDADLRNKVDRWAEDAGAHLVNTSRDEVATVISDTVTRWDATEAEVIEARADKPITRLRCVARLEDGTEVLRGECLVYTMRPE